VPIEEGEPSLSLSRTSTTVEGEPLTKASTVACGHDLLQHDIEEGGEAVGRNTTEPVVRHDAENRGP
jgi:hypothetical protein